MTVEYIVGAVAAVLLPICLWMQYNMVSKRRPW